jgi:triacylglycerol lipase
MRLKSSYLTCIAALNGIVSSFADKMSSSSSSSSSITRKATAILNGVVGDYLDASANPLSLEMGFYRKGTDRLLDLSSFSMALDQGSSLAGVGFGDDVDDDEARSMTNATTSRERTKRKICILVHGLTDDESTWEFDESKNTGTRGDYGSLLQRDFGAAPLYVRYNTGLHISTNGRKLNHLMNQLMAPIRVNSDINDNNDVHDFSCEIMFVCHSMGGLVTRSALHYGVQEKSPWVSKVTRVVFLGTPHQGSHWEQLGNVVSKALGSVPLPYMKLAEKTANLRSAGIKDLRYGYILDEDWQETKTDDHNNEDDTDNAVENDYSFFKNTKKRAHFVDSIAYFVATGTVTANPRHLLSQWIGDALVQKASAEGRSENQEHHLGFNPDNFCEFAGVGHVQLARDPAVYEQIKTWFETPKTAACQHQPGPTRSGSADRDVDCSPTVFDQLKTQKPVSTWAKRKGVASLLQDAIGNGATAVESVHMALTDETFDILSKVCAKPIARTVKRIKTVHDMTVAGVYGIIRGVNYSLTEVAKITCDVMDEESNVERQQTKTTGQQTTTNCDEVVDQADELTMTDKDIMTCT